MNLTLINNITELSAQEQKALYTEGADIYTGVFYLVADTEHFTQVGKDVVPQTPALRALSVAANVSWIITNFRGQKKAFGSSSA